MHLMKEYLQKQTTGTRAAVCARAIVELLVQIMHSRKLWFRTDIIATPFDDTPAHERVGSGQICMPTIPTGLAGMT